MGSYRLKFPDKSIQDLLNAASDKIQINYGRDWEKTQNNQNMYKITFNEDYIIETTYGYSPMRKNTYSKTRVEELEGRELIEAQIKKNVRV